MKSPKFIVYTTACFKWLYSPSISRRSVVVSSPASWRECSRTLLSPTPPWRNSRNTSRPAQYVLPSHLAQVNNVYTVCGLHPTLHLFHVQSIAISKENKFLVNSEKGIFLLYSMPGQDPISCFLEWSLANSWRKWNVKKNIIWKQAL